MNAIWIYWHLLYVMLHRQCAVNVLDGTVYRIWFEGSCADAWSYATQIGGVLVWL